MTVFEGTSVEYKQAMEAVNACFASAQVLLLIGEPGIGKTAIIDGIAARQNCVYRVIIGSAMDPTDVSGLPAQSTMEVGGDTYAVTANTAPDWLIEVIKGAERDGMAILFLDELTTSPPAVQAAMLTMIQSRRVGRYRIPDNVLMIAAANPPSQAADGWELAPPMANRLIHYPYRPSESDWLTGMACAWNQEVTEQEMNVRSMIVAFLSNNTELIHAFPEEEAKRGGAWPSFRSWDNSAKALGALDKPYGPTGMILLRGAVGEVAASAFNTWYKNLKIPAYDDVMSNPDGVSWSKLRADETHAIISNVVSRITKDNYLQSMAVFDSAQRIGKKTDICAAQVIPLIRNVKKVFNGTGETFDRFKMAQLLSNYPEAKEALSPE